MIGGLVASSGGKIRSVIADGAYDGEPAYKAIRSGRPVGSPPIIVIAPKGPSIPDKGQPHGGSERERHAAEISRSGGLPGRSDKDMASAAWSRRPFRASRTSMTDGLTSRTFGSQRKEGAIHIKIANRNMLLARPVSERVR